MKILLLSLLTAISCSFISPIIDSNMTFEEAIKGSKAPQDVIDSIEILNVKYISFDGKLHSGQIVVRKSVSDDVQAIFELILKEKFPVGKCVPIVQYGWSDSASMADNNSSAFNYRTIAGTNRLSPHSFGRAVDINPRQNPVVYANGRVSPKGAKYDIKKPGTFSSNSPIVKEFERRGWRWGGTFKSFKDNHHFDKN